MTNPKTGRIATTRRLLAAVTFYAALSTIAAHAEQKKAEESGVVLPEVLVQGSTYQTDTTDSYTTDLISVGDKDTRPLREVPQSTTVLTRERLNDGNYTSLDTALKETPGVVVLSNDEGRSSLYSRGFEFDSFYLNGLPTPLSSIYGTQPDMVMVDHVEILRGPSGLFGGSGEPSGAINMRLKQASDVPRVSVDAIYGSYGNKRIEGDLTGPLVESGALRGRLVGALSSKDGFVEDTFNKVGVIYGTLQADIAEDTTATLSVSHQERRIKPFNGLPTLSDGTLLNLDRSTFTGADWNYFDNRVTNYLAEVEHRFEDGGHAKLSALYSRADVDFLYAYAAGAANSAGVVTSGTRWLARDYQEDAFALDAHISRPFELFGLENNIIAGIDYRGSDNSLSSATGVISGAQSLYNWNTGIARPRITLSAPSETETRQIGVYGQWRIKPTDQLTLIGGGRFTWFDSETGNSKVSANGEFTPYAGITYDLTNWLTAYGSFTEIFQPQSVTNAAGNILDPRTGKQYEVGLKAEVFENANATLAYFNLTDKNRAVSDPNNLSYYLANGEANIQGLELEVSGTILDRWEATAAYTFTDTEFKNTNRAAGSEFYTPEHMVQLWTKYTFDDRTPALDGFFIGGGVKMFSSFKNVSRTAAGGATSIEAPGYAVFDLQAGYKFNEHVTASLTVNNVFDKTYYERVGGTSVFNFYGEPRTVVLRVGTTF